VATAQTLHVEVGQEAPGVVVIRCIGEVDLASCRQLTDAIEWSYMPELKVLRIDLSELVFIDSEGIRCLLQASERCESLGVRLEVTPSEQVQRVFELVGGLPFHD
jgi:anti-anti-sigma factor